MIKLKLFMPTLFLSLSIFCVTQCSDEGEDEDEEEATVLETGEGTTPTSGRSVSGRTDLRVYMFGNSLLMHEVTPEPTEEKKVPHWLGLMATTAGTSLTVDGRYGFLRQFADFSEIGPQWGFTTVGSSWTDESVAFGDVPFNTIMLTPTNFIQYQGPAEPYFDDQNTTPISTSLSTIDQTIAAHPGIPIYIYAGWADMAGYGTFPSGVDLASYYGDAQNSYHNWFIDYHDRLIRARPDVTIKMIPVYLILAKLLSSEPLSAMTITDVYEDDAPHGQPTLYLLASMITYAALFQAQAPADFTIPTTVHALVRDNYSTINDQIWTELNGFTHSDGTGRVF